MLFLTAVTGTWATPRNHVVNSDTVDDIFSGEGNTLGDGVATDDVLDFQGPISITHSLVINKRETIQGSSNAKVCLNTVIPENVVYLPVGSFVINKDAAGTKVQDISFENTQVWIYNTSNVKFTGVTFSVKDANWGKWYGHVSVRYSDDITFDGCTVYTEDNNDAQGCALLYSSNCTFKDSRFESVGYAGYPLYIDNLYIDDQPSGFSSTGSNDNCFTNCTFIGSDNSRAHSRVWIVGQRNSLIGCTVDAATTLFYGSDDPSALADGFVISNSTFTKDLSLPVYTTLENCTVNNPSSTRDYAVLEVKKGSKITNNTIKGSYVKILSNSNTGSTFTGNKLFARLLVYSGSKDNTITGNTIVSPREYAVELSSDDNAGNNVSDNVLLALGHAGDAAVNKNNGSGNTISGNKGVADAGNGLTWTYDPAVSTLTIGGTGAIADYEQTTDGHSTAPWAFIDDQITRVVIADGVTAIGDNAFYGSTGVTSVIAKGAAAPTLGTNAFDPTAPIARVYVPGGKAATYQQAWTAYAGSISEYMTCGTDAIALYDAHTHTLTISDYGAMADFGSADNQPWKELQGELQKVVVECTITHVGDHAFANCPVLAAVYVEGSGATVGTSTFSGNATARKIFVPVGNIGYYTSSWTDYADDIRSAGFCGASGNEESVAWEYNDNTNHLTISGTGAMADYTIEAKQPWSSARGQIQVVTIASGVTTIGQHAFQNCSSITTVSIPESVTSIDYAAFIGCYSLATIVIPEGVTSIDRDVFAGCKTLASVSLPTTLTSIGSRAFSYCPCLTTINIPDKVTTIENSTFSNSGLTSIDIPATVTSIDNGAFYYCTSLAEVCILATSLDVYGNDAFKNNASNRLIYVPAASVQTYQDKWPAYKDCIVALPVYDVKMADGTADAANWTIASGENSVAGNNADGLTGLTKKTHVTLQYNGRLKVKGVTAVTDATLH